ncbi:hypothetical protein R3P38DRAFT_2948801 [Favolaschia claudopus]|uniref:Uncharacterized protein n=1 Tax=Favolaschia claudopus TaxID=2862362 RepID=A0AAW0AK95_9AGAR
MWPLTQVRVSRRRGSMISNLCWWIWHRTQSLIQVCICSECSRLTLPPLSPGQTCIILSCWSNPRLSFFGPLRRETSTMNRVMHVAYGTVTG